MAYVTIPNSDVDQGSPVTVALMTALRDNLEAALAGDAGSPIAGFTRISSASVAGASTVDFTGLDNTRYESYLFDYRNVVGSVPQMRVSTDGGATFDSGASDYKWGMMIDGTKSSSAGASFMRIAPTNTGTGGMSGVIMIIDPDAAEHTIILSSFSDDINVIESRGRRVASTAVDAIQFMPSSGTFTSGTITMYGRGL